MVRGLRMFAGGMLIWIGRTVMPTTDDHPSLFCNEELDERFGLSSD